MGANQHFLPQFLIRKFSEQHDGNSVRIFILSAARIQPGSPIKGQAYKKWYYGHDGVLEDRLSKLEYLCANLISEISITKTLPKFPGPGYDLLRTFILLQANRTPQAAERAESAFEEMMLTAVSLDPNAPDLSDVRIRLTDPGRFMLSIGQGMLSTVEDLRFALIQTVPECPFILGDVGLSRDNLVVRKYALPHSRYGIGNIGILLFLPISPTLCLMLYDPGAYALSNPNRVVTATNYDVAAINELEVSDSKHVVFLPSDFSSEQILPIIRKTANFRKHPKHTFSVLRPSRTNSDQNSLLAHTHHLVYDPDDHYSFLYLKERTEQLRNHKSMSIRRPSIRISENHG